MFETKLLAFAGVLGAAFLGLESGSFFLSDSYVPHVELGENHTESSLDGDQYTAERTVIRIGAQTIPGAFWEGGDGDYNRVYERLISGYDGAIDLAFLPARRQGRDFESGKLDCMYVALERRELKPGHPVDFVGPINTIFMTAFVRRGEADIKTPAELHQKTVGVDVNLHERLVAKGVEPTLSIEDQNHMMNLLVRGRIEALVGFDYDLNLIARQLELDDQVTRTSLDMDHWKDGMVCHQTTKTAAFVKTTRSNLRRMQSDGFLEGVFGPSAGRAE